MRQRECEVFDLSTNYVGPKGLEPILEMARNIYSLRSLDLRNNMLEHESVAKLVKALVRHPKVSSINLAFNLLHDSCVELIMHLIKSNTQIVEVILHGNEISPEEIARIEEQLCSNRAAAKAAAEESAAQGASGARKYRPYRCEVTGSLTSANSGGPHPLRFLEKEPTVHAEAFRTCSGEHFPDPSGCSRCAPDGVYCGALQRPAENC